MLLILVIVLIIAFMLQQKTEIFTKPKMTNTVTLSKLKQTLYIIDKLFADNNIVYWMQGGTLLGAERHKNVIPWDDDGDIVVPLKYKNHLLAVVPQLKQLGYGFASWWGGYKIFPMNGTAIKKVDGGVYDYKYPFVDVFIMSNMGERYDFIEPLARDMWPHHYHLIEDLLPLKRYAFDTFTLNGPRNAVPYLNRAYGADWRTVAYMSYDHSREEQIATVSFNIRDVL